MWFGIVVAITLVAYARSCEVPFHFDDHAVLVAQEEGYLSTLGGFVGYARARVVPFATFALNFWVGAQNPYGYHAVNLAVHLLATFLVFELALALCRTPRLRGSWLAEQQLPFAVAAAAFFACHPIQVQAVTYVVQRFSSMATLFYVGSVVLYVRGRNAQTIASERTLHVGTDPLPGPPPLPEVATGKGTAMLSFVGSALLALGAFLSKESSASLPAAIVLVEWAFFGSRGLGKRALRLAPYIVLVLLIPLLWVLLAPGRERALVSGSPTEQLAGVARLLAFRANPSGDVGPLDYLRTQFVVIPRYLGLVVLPWGFNVDHDVAVERALSPPVVEGMVLLIGLLALGVYALRRWPVTGFGMLWIFVALGVESSILPISDVMVEHRMYLAMPGIALVVGNGFAWLYRRQRSLAAVGGTAVVVGLAALTFLRNEVWLTPVSLWTDAVVKSPGKARVHANLGLALTSAGRSAEAIKHYCRALALDPNDRQARTNLDAALEADTLAKADSGHDIVLEGQPTGAGGFALELKPRDPCRDR